MEDYEANTGKETLSEIAKDIIVYNNTISD